MPLEAYAPETVALAGQPLADAKIVAFYDPDGPTPRGALTGVSLDSECEVGPLEIVGLREGRRWRVVTAAIAVESRSAIGCEFRLCGPLQRTPLE